MNVMGDLFCAKLLSSLQATYNDNGQQAVFPSGSSLTF